MLSKDGKIRVLENFYAIDYAMFGKPVTKMHSCCPALIEDYVNTKGALMSIMIEMYKLIDHVPTAIAETVNSKVLSKMAKSSATIARENCKKLVVTDKGRIDIKTVVKEELTKNPDSLMEEVVKEQIRAKAFSLAVDNLLIARTLAESTAEQTAKLNEWEGKIVEDAYKILRDNLVEAAIDILNIDDVISD